jgi:flagellar biosynthesis/type III secretory pathway protein FliH
MTLSRGRILRAEQLGGAPSAVAPRESGRDAPGARQTGARIARREALEAADQARARLERAELEASRILAQAEARAERVLEQARAEGLLQASARLAGAWAALQDREARADEASADRIVQIARLLAERVLGESVRLEPDTVVALARQALAQMRRARSVRLLASPADAAVLESRLGELGAAAGCVVVVADDSRAPGGVRIESELGTVDADLGQQLDRLVDALRRGAGGERP